MNDKQATAWAFCPDCERLHLGIQGDAVACSHVVPDGRINTRIIRAQVARAVCDTGWRFFLEPQP